MSQADLKERKLAKRFQLLDVNHDGYITRDDYDQLCQKLLAEYPDHEPSVANRLWEAYDVLWRTLAAGADVDGDGKVSLEEFVHSSKAGVSDRQDGFDRTIRPAAEAVLDLADTDKSGSLSEVEFIRLMGVFGVAGPEAKECFQDLDADGDGRLSVDEKLAADRDFHQSDDVSSPGNKLFGLF